jgi:hypothetical protein
MAWTRAFPIVLLVLAVGIAAAYPVLTLELSGAFRSGAPADVLVISILPVELVAIACVVLGVALQRQASGAPGTFGAPTAP